MTFAILTVVGARPQFMKAAPVSAALAAHGAIRERLIHTGQHFSAEMSDVFFDELGMRPPDRNLHVSGGGHGDMTGRMMIALEAELRDARPDAVLVYGDTNSTLAGALVGAKALVPVIHVEAGLRSFNRAMPEETNRVLTDHVSALLLCATRTAMENLAAEGIRKGVHWIGDVMEDTVRSIDLSGLAPCRGEAYVLLTLHRAENTDDPDRFAALLDYVRREAGSRRVVMPVHPRIDDRREEIARRLPTADLIRPLGYLEMQRTLAQADLVMTDSGGLQKEAYFHRRPCVTLRDETEWVETVAAGWNRLWTQADYATPRSEIGEYGGGQAARRAVEAIAAHFAL